MKLKKLSTVEHLIVHCAATPPTMDIGAKDIDAWHRKRGWVKIGYHFVIRRNGSVEPGRAVDEIGAHTQGRNNDSIGICLVGGVDNNGEPADNFTPAQMDALRRLLVSLKHDYPHAQISGHRDWAPKACPSFDAKARFSSLFP